MVNQPLTEAKTLHPPARGEVPPPGHPSGSVSVESASAGWEQHEAAGDAQGCWFSGGTSHFQPQPLQPLGPKKIEASFRGRFMTYCNIGISLDIWKWPTENDGKTTTVTMVIGITPRNWLIQHWLAIVETPTIVLIVGGFHSIYVSWGLLVSFLRLLYSIIELFRIREVAVNCSCPQKGQCIRFGY